MRGRARLRGQGIGEEFFLERRDEGENEKGKNLSFCSGGPDSEIIRESYEVIDFVHHDRGPLSLLLILLDSPTCCEEFTELVANLRITHPAEPYILPSPPPICSGRVTPSTAHPRTPLRGCDDFLFASRELQFTKCVPVLSPLLRQMLSCLLGDTTIPDPDD